jgi:hypothetical protein
MIKNKGIIYFISMLSMLLFPMITLASYSRPYNDYFTTPLEKMISHGEYVIYVLKGGTWQKAGKLTYDKYFRERKIDLSEYLLSDKKAHIRLVQKGGGAAHIDSVLLGGNPPLEVKNVENGLKKLSTKDFDVVDAFEKSIEVVFNGNGEDKTLKLTARVEDTVIRGVPFVFPLQSMYVDMDTDAHFYTYKLNSNRGGIEIDGALNEVSHKSPFFKVYSQSVTGHPSTFTYGWVWNDDKNLYVAIDFTGDNTMDGDRDYAKVYVNINNEIKEFKVSVPETKWGSPEFSYTDKVNYQHKVYEFKIPLSEITEGGLYKQDKLLLAFSAYGTNGGGGGAC